MCVDIRKKCQCGRQNVQLHLRDNIMSKEVVTNLYCPDCSAGLQIDEHTMLNDNGWVLVYDMELARFQAAAALKMDPQEVRPDFLFDQGYATWQELYPGEKQDIMEERREIMKLAQVDRHRYLIEITRWNIARLQRLKAAGWRKAQQA